METYRHSGAVPLGGLALTILVGLVVAAVLGVVYTYAIVNIPIVYINFFVTCALGAAIGFAVGVAARAGKIRNTFVVGVLGLAIGVVGLYVAWAVDPTARGYNPEIKDAATYFRPNELLGYMKVFYKDGMWTYRDKAVTGIPLAIIWLVEAGLILALANVVARTFIASRTFCERCRQWTVVEEGVQELALESGEERALERILSGDLAALNELHRAPEGAEGCLRLDLARCPTCTESNFLTIQMVSQAVDAQGNLQTKTEALFSNLLLGEADALAFRHVGRERPEEETEASEEAAEDLDSPSEEADEDDEMA
ncbi:MAG: hypothetical protein ACYTG0_36575 [Planctomycetota bacterium]|jgi:hypothetical protein